MSFGSRQGAKEGAKVRTKCIFLRFGENFATSRDRRTRIHYANCLYMPLQPAYLFLNIPSQRWAFLL